MLKKLNLCFLVESNPSGIGGHYCSLGDVALTCARQGHRVKIVVFLGEFDTKPVYIDELPFQHNFELIYIPLISYSRAVLRFNELLVLNDFNYLFPYDQFSCYTLKSSKVRFKNKVFIVIDSPGNCNQLC